MKRVGYLFDELISFSNLWTAWRKAYKGSHNAYGNKAFFFRAEQEVMYLQHELRTGSYKPGPYRYFEIFDPKQRTIAVAPFRDRIIHHALINILEPLYEPVFDAHSYATRKGKGSHKAILQAQIYMRRFPWFLKSDIRKYFDSINHSVLSDLIQRKIKDRVFLNILSSVIANGGTDGTGLPIGNLTSQFLANVYLDPLDKFVRRYCPSTAYIRYMDDIVLFGSNRESLKVHSLLLTEFLLDALFLNLKEGATILNRSSAGLSFLGARIYPSLIRIHPKTLKRSMNTLRQRSNEHERGIIDDGSYTATLNSVAAHLSFFNTAALRSDLFHPGQGV